MNLISVREIIRDTIAEEMRLDPNIFLLGEEVGEYRNRSAFSKFVFGRASPVARASPVGVGRQNSAGLTNANSSNISRYLSSFAPIFFSVQLRWQIKGGLLLASI